MGMLTEVQRERILDDKLLQLAHWGGTLRARTATSAVVETGKPVNHVLHLLATVFLCGLWLPVWLIIASTGGVYMRTLTVDETGEIHDSRDAVIARDRKMQWIGLALFLLFIAFVYWRS